MVPYNQVRLAVGGMNLGVSAFSGLLAYLIISNSISISRSQGVALLSSVVAIFVSITHLLAGVINVIGNNR